MSVTITHDSLFLFVAFPFVAIYASSFCVKAKLSGNTAVYNSLFLKLKLKLVKRFFVSIKHTANFNTTSNATNDKQLQHL